MKNCTNLLVLCYFLSGVTGNMLIIDHQLLKVRIMTVITLFLAVVIILIINRSASWCSLFFRSSISVVSVCMLNLCHPPALPKSAELYPAAKGE
jgi:uncharacterized membrane protein